MIDYPHTYKLAIQCTDRNSGKIGSFIYLPAAPFLAASPVFKDCQGLFRYMNKRGLVLAAGTIAGVVETENKGRIKAWGI